MAVAHRMYARALFQAARDGGKLDVVHEQLGDFAAAIAEVPAKTPFGWAHGIGWIAMSLLCVYAVRRRILPMWLGIMIAVVGGLGPFAGSAGFVVCERRRRRQEAALERGMV